MSSNKILTVGPYAGMALEEVISADPWYIVELYTAGGNHGIKEATYYRALSIIGDDLADDDYDPDTDLFLGDAQTVDDFLVSQSIRDYHRDNNIE